MPTLREQGWDESVEMFVVLVAPKGLPAPVLDRLNQAIDKVAANEKFRTFITDELIMAPVTFGREAALSYMKEANDRFGKQAAEAKKQ